MIFMCWSINAPKTPSMPPKTRRCCCNFCLFCLLSIWRICWWRALTGLLHRTSGRFGRSVHAKSRIGQGDFSSEITVAPNTENSVLGWLAKTQVSLKQTSLQRQQAEAGLKRANADLQPLCRSHCPPFARAGAPLASYAEMLPRQLAPHLNNPQAELSLAFIGQQARQMKRNLLDDIQRYLAADQPRGKLQQLVAGAMPTRSSTVAGTLPVTPWRNWCADCDAGRAAARLV